MTEAERNELHALLVRAGHVEVQRQSAIQRGDTAARLAAETELQRLHHQHHELEQKLRRDQSP